MTDGSWRPDRAMTLSELLQEHWMPAQRMRGLRPATLAQYDVTIRRWLVPNVGGIRVAALSARDVQKLAETLRTRDGLSARTAQLAVGVVKVGLRLGGRQRLDGSQSGRRRTAPSG